MSRLSCFQHARGAAIVAVALVTLAGAGPVSAETTGRFAGPKANTGTATFSHAAGKRTLTLSSDFQVPATPDPHWQVVDNDGRVYLLQKLTVKGLTGDKMNRSITLPAYIKSVAKVQFWCAYAEVLLGEASFGGGNSTN